MCLVAAVFSSFVNDTPVFCSECASSGRPARMAGCCKAGAALGSMVPAHLSLLSLLLRLIPCTAVMLPIVLSWATKARLPVRQLLIPLSCERAAAWVGWPLLGGLFKAASCQACLCRSRAPPDARRHALPAGGAAPPAAPAPATADCCLLGGLNTTIGTSTNLVVTGQFDARVLDPKRCVLRGGSGVRTVQPHVGAGAGACVDSQSTRGMWCCKACAAPPRALSLPSSFFSIRPAASTTSRAKHQCRCLTSRRMVGGWVDGRAGGDQG